MKNKGQINKGPSLSWWQQLVRGIHRRLIVPMLRERKPAEYTARGVLVGLIVGLTPTVGIQIPIVLLIWIIIHKVYKSWKFNPVIAIAWTLVSNIATLPFLYYLFVVTGRIMLGRFENLRDFDTFRERLGQSLPEDIGWLDSLWHYIVALFDNFGLPLFVGCVPWSLLGGWVGYYWSLHLLTKYRARHPLKRHRSS